MKRLMQSTGGHILLAFSFLIPFLVLPTAQVEAQALQQMETTQSYNWKSETDATTLLLAHLDLLNQQMPSYTEGTSLYDNALRRVAYFKDMIKQIHDGAAVEDAVELSLPAAATLGFSKEASYTSKVVLHALHEEARIMLTN